MEKVNNLIIFFRPTIIDPEKNSDQGFTSLPFKTFNIKMNGKQRKLLLN